jgi:S-adenosylmethionine-diacylgycerolhomoserine-N-methlytransferase
MLIKEDGHAIRQQRTIRHYYQFQSTIYDATRWSFLFGRKKIMDLVALASRPQHIIEVGCGTGYNVARLARKFPDSKITGLDISTSMLEIARNKLEKNPKIRLVEKAYANGATGVASADLILFSYVLTMINPQYPEFINRACKDLKPGGKIAVVDFHSSKHRWFKKHMANHHVRMDGHLDGLLKSTFKPLHFEVKSAYGGLWNYFYFVGEK